MEQHPMPRQITTFEFKLIGFLTLKQFIYLVIFLPIGFIVFKLIPIPILNVLLAAIVAGAGIAFAFVPINDRPMDVWIKNFLKRLTSPTQYVYSKKNPPIYFLKNLFFVNDPHRVMTHIESQEKLAEYLSKTKAVQAKPVASSKKQSISSLLQKPSHALVGQKKPVAARPVTAPAVAVRQPAQSAKPVVKTVAAPPQAQQIKPAAKRPFFTGVVKNHRLIPLPGILIYVKDQNGQVLRLLKSNPHGVFATFNQLQPGDYLFEFKDPRKIYFFDTMKIQLSGSNPKPLELFSKELL